MPVFRGQCHCGAVQFEIHNQEALEGPRRCDCSLCQKKGVVMGTAGIADLIITRGEDKLSLYQWNTRTARHYFCSVCGIYTHHQRRVAPDEFGFNLACIEDVDPALFASAPMTDGRALSLVEEAEARKP
ncbi:MAG TPA: aldehyde-activating protein [Gammaproteobacteria bacterium]|nr:aldehyde-activating protein [Gammaproteobacteria bacterium]HCA36509.1 aldehyde-activating protein [Gammaproteobacteria bacterium]